MSYNQKIIDKLDEYGLRSTDCLDILDICNTYIESEKKKIKIQSVKGFAGIVKQMRTVQQAKGNSKKAEELVDKTLKQIERYGI